MTGTVAGLAVIGVLAALLLAPRLRTWRHARRLLAEDEAMALTKEHPARAALAPDTPGPGHHRGGHMVIDVWRCGCIYTWTRATGWVHDFDCLDQEIRELLS